MTYVLVTALEAGLLYAPVALALFLSYRILDIADLTTDGSFTLGCSVSAVVCLAGFPILAIPAAMIAAAMSGFITAFLQTKLGVPSILAGIVTNIGLYTGNIMVMGASNRSIFKVDTVFSLFAEVGGTYYKVILLAVILVVLCGFLVFFMGTRLGLSIRATGDNIHMIQASSINPSFTITLGLCLSNAMTGLSGALVAQYGKSADVNMGTGMVVIGLAALIIGETVFGKGSMPRRVAAIVGGSIVYRIIYALALRMNVPAEYMKLVSAVIVALAIATPTIKGYFAFRKTKKANIASMTQGGDTHA